MSVKHLAARAILAIASLTGCLLVSYVEADASATQRVDQAKSVTLFVVTAGSKRPLLASELQRLPNFNVGLLSPSLGSYYPTQMLVDLGQGSRLASSLYRPVKPPNLRVKTYSGSTTACVLGWRDLQRRASGKVVPGLLGTTVKRSGLPTAWVTVTGADQVAATVAVAGRDKNCGVVTGAVTSTPERFAASVVRSQQHARFVVASLPAGQAAMEAIFRATVENPRRMIIVVQVPKSSQHTRLLPVAIHGLAAPGGLSSSGTSRPGLISTIDIAPTILARLGLNKPVRMQGSITVPARHSTAQELHRTAKRLESVSGRRAAVMRWAFLLTGSMLLLVTAVATYLGRLGSAKLSFQRLGALALFWVPSLMLISGGLELPSYAEASVVVVGSLLLALLVDRLVAWPHGLWLPTLALILLHGVDFALFDSHFIGQSLLGPNPLFGARFFGIGNELEAVVAICSLVGVCTAVAASKVRYKQLCLPVAGFLVALFVGMGRLGADVGGVVMVSAGFMAATVYLIRLRITPLRLLMLLLIPVVLLVGVVALDLLSGGSSHLSKTLFATDSVGDLLEIVGRRMRESIGSINSISAAVALVLAVAALVLGVVKRQRILQPLMETTGVDIRPYQAALIGGLTATVVGALANDSGPAITVIATVYLVASVGYLRAGGSQETSGEG